MSRELDSDRLRVERYDIQLTSGEVLRNLQSAQYEMNPEQRLWVFGVNFDEHGGWFNFQYPTDGVEPMYLGKLSEAGWMMRNTALNSLNRDGWDFDECADPECIILNKVET